VVELLRRYANRADLLHDLTRAVDRLRGAEVVPVEEQPEELVSAGRRSRQDILAVRFSPDDLARMIEKYRAGATIQAVAVEFRIGSTTLKRLIRERGARRKDRE
jgi:hypothetical protein